jgi:hypothetical protein
MLGAYFNFGNTAWFLESLSHTLFISMVVIQLCFPVVIHPNASACSHVCFPGD